MKAKILQYLSELIDCDNEEKSTGLKKLLNDLICNASLQLDEEKAEHVKKLIMSTVSNYSNNSDESLKAALQEHHKTLDDLLHD